MAELLLTQAVNQAEQAIETGNYGGAIETCQRILGEFPEFARAHRILAEAYAEQGDTESARHAYQRTLERDPQSIPAHLGLAMIAEEAGELEGALAHYQVAWEIDPRRRDLREHVSRISQQLFGDEGRLYLTRAALASLHFHAGRWDRAVSEGAQVLQELNQRVDVQIRMAEALWRRGDDEEARQVCTRTLRTLPSAVVPLLILADIHRRQSNEGVAADMLEQARAIDPDGVRAADLIMVGLDDQADFLAVEDVPTIEERVLMEEPVPRYAPAPDFIGGDDEEPEPPPATPEPRHPEAPAQEAARQEQDLTPDPGLQPFRWEDIGDEDLEAPEFDSAAGQEDADLSGLLGEDVPAQSAQEQEDEEISFDLFTDEEIEQARPSGDQPAGYTGMLESLDSEGVQPFDPGAGLGDLAGGGGSMGPETPEEVVEEFSQDPFQPEAPAEPTTPLSGEPEQEPQAEAGEPDPFDVDWGQVDAEIEDARPGDIPPGYTDELRSLDEVGVEPFSLEDREEDVEHEPPEDTDNLNDLLGEQPPTSPGDVSGVEQAAADESDEIGLDALTRDLAAGSGETAAYETSAEPEQQETDDSVAEAERAGALESLEELFGDYEAGTFQESESEPERTADPESFDLSELQDASASDADTAMEPWEPAAESPEIAPSYEPYAPETLGENPVADADVFGEPLEPQETAEMGPARAPEAAPPAATGGSLEAIEMSAARLGFGEELLERARGSKQELIRRGLIEGSQPLPGAGVSLDTLRGEVERDPRNVDHRIALAAALVEEDPDEALEQYRWLYRHAPERATEIVEELTRLIAVMSEREVGAHRLLAAVYRRHGDWRLAATHYEESLMLARRHLG